MTYYRAYIAGALTGVSYANRDIKEVYEEIESLCTELNILTYLPHRQGTDPIKNPLVSSYDVWKKDASAVFNVDVVIAYVGLPSIGVGSEIELARIGAKEVILWWFEGEKVSRMARGNPAVVHQIEASSIDSLLSELHSYLSERQRNRTRAC